MVFTLTRFFRNGIIHGPPGPKLIKTEDMGNVGESKSVVSCSTFDLEKSPAVDEACFAKSVSSLPEVKRSNNSTHLNEVLPANRSSLSSYKDMQAFNLGNSSDLIQHEKKLLLSIRKNTQYQNHEVIDLTCNSLLDEKPRKEELITHCTTRKRRVLTSEADVMQCFNNTSEVASDVERSQSNSSPSLSNLVKHENPHIFGSRSKKAAQGSELLCKVECTSQSRDAKIQSQKGEGVDPPVPPCGGDETKGSAFLIQVQEKLSATEYKEFVGFMKAMKSKAMRISQVLQSIAKLFSGPERLPLLRRFKDFVPAKYHSLYEQYLVTND